MIEVKFTPCLKSCLRYIWINVYTTSEVIFTQWLNSWLHQVWCLDYNILEVTYLNKFLQHVQSPIYTMFGDMFSFFLKTFLHNDFMFEDMFTHCSKTCGHYILIPIYTIFEEVFAKTSITKWNHDFYAWILKHSRPLIHNHVPVFSYNSMISVK